MTADDDRAARLAAALRANLARRKAQTRARKDPQADRPAPPAPAQPSAPGQGRGLSGPEPGAAQDAAPERPEPPADPSGIVRGDKPS